jgi:hypothetical protein
MATKYAQQKGLRGFLTNKPYPDMPRWRRALLMSTSFGRMGMRIAWALKNRQHGTKDPILRPKVQSSAYGNVIQRAYGRMRIAGQILWATEIGGYRSLSNGHVVEAPVGEETPLYVSLAIGLCRGPVDAITKIWADDKLIFDASSNGGYSVTGISFEKFFYLGTSGQEPDEWMEQIEGTGDVPAYRHRAYAVLKNFPLASFGNNVPNFEFEVVSSASAAYLDASATTATADIPEDNWLLSRLGPYIYGESGGILSKYNRNTRTLLIQRDLAPLIQGIGGGSASLAGRLVMNEATEDFYLLCQDGSSRSFIVRFRPHGGGALADNFSDRTPASEAAVEIDGLVAGNVLYTVDQNGAKLRRYLITPGGLVRDWTRDGPAANLVPGNLTIDDQGCVWYASREDISGAHDNTYFYLTRATPGGELTHYEISTIGNCFYVAYDASHDWLIVGGAEAASSDSFLAQFHVEGSLTGTVASSLDGLSNGSSWSLFSSQRRFTGGRFWSWDSSGGAVYRAVTSGTMESDDSIATASWASVNFVGLAFDAGQNGFWTRHSATVLKIALLQRYGYDSITVGSVINDLCQAAGLLPGQIDTSAITDVCTGYAITSKGTARSAIEPLMDAYLLDARESGGVLEFFKRGDASVVTIDADDLGAGPDGQPEPELVEEEITPEQLLPLRVEVTYLSPTRDSDEHTQDEKRRADCTTATGEAGISLPVVLSDDQARRLAQNVLYDAWVSRFQYAFALPASYLRLDAGDVVTLPHEGESLRVRLTAVELGADYLVLCTGVLDDVNAYASVVSGSSTTATQSVQHLPGSHGLFLDCALPRDRDEGKGPLLLAAPDGDEDLWNGATLYRAVDGQTYLPLASVGAPSALGELTTTLAKTQPHVWDTTSSFTVRLFYGTLTSATQAEIEGDESLNLAAVGNARRGWELLQFADVTDNGDDTYTLSTLRRYRRGTEWVAEDVYDDDGNLIADYDNLGDHFALLDFGENRIRAVNPQDSEIGEERLYRIASAGGSYTGGAPFEMTYRGAALKPYAPGALDFELVVDEVPNYHMHLRWTRRTRVGGNLTSGTEVPLAEEYERYELDILDDDGVTVLNTYTGITRPDVVSGVNLAAAGGGTDQFTRASGSFVDDGFIAGTHILVAGFADAANNGIFLISGEPTATILPVRRSEYAAANLVTEAAGAGRTIEALQPGFIYTVAMQTADYGEPRNDITFRVHQLSARAGRGYGATRVIDPSEV